MREIAHQTDTNSGPDYFDDGCPSRIKDHATILIGKSTPTLSRPYVTVPSTPALRKA